MSEQNDISEVQVGDKVVDQDGDIKTVVKVSSGVIVTNDHLTYSLKTGYFCDPWVRASITHFIRPASADDIARHDKRQLSTWLNSIKWMDKSIPHLERIKLAVEDHKGGE